MGQAKQRSKRKDEITAAAKRCVYCDATENLTLEHMPPRGLFINRDRPSGWEFAACDMCNQGTRGTDAVGQLLSLIEPVNEQNSMLDKIRNLRPTLRKHAPGVLEEVGRLAPVRETTVPYAGKRYPSVEIELNGPNTTFHLNRFSAKIALAGFHHVIGRPAKTDGMLFTMWFANAGMSEKMFIDLCQLLPMFGQLKQGKKTSGSQFSVRYNTNGIDLLGALFAFQENFFVLSFVADGDEFPNSLNEIFSEFDGSRHPTARLSIPSLEPFRQALESD